MSPQRHLNSTLLAGLLLVAASPALAAGPDAASPSAAPSAVVIAGPSVSPSPIPDPCAAVEPVFTKALPTQPAATGSGDGGASQAANPCPSPEPPQIGLGIGPSQIILEAGQTTGAFDVFNAGNIEMRFNLYPSDLVRDGQGSWVPLPVDTVVERAAGSPGMSPMADVDASAAPTPVDPGIALGAASWLTFDADEFLLAPGETKRATFVVDVPADALPGDHFTGIRVVGALGGGAESSFDEQMRGRASLKSRVAQTATVIVRVPGDTFASVKVPSFDSFLSGLMTTTTGTIGFTPSIANTGTVAAIWMPVAGPSGDLTSMIPTLTLRPTTGLDAHDELLFEGKRADDGSVTLSPLVVLPGATHTQKLTLADAPLFGTYDYIYTLPGSTADGRETITQTGHLTIVNLQKVLYWIVLPLLALMVLLSLVLLGRRQSKHRRQAAEAARARDLDRARQEAYELARREQHYQGRGPW